MRVIFFVFWILFASVQSQAGNESSKTLLIIGDSLTEGYGVTKDSSYPMQLEKLFKKDKKDIRVNNAGSSGSTSASLVHRLKWHLKNKPNYLMIALGANDGLRGFPIESTQKNLSDGIIMAQKNGIKVILAGMLMPMNFGEVYRKKFEKMYKDIIKKHDDIIFIPFLLDGVGGVKELNLSDGIHPNEEGHKKVAKTVYKVLKEKL